MPKYIENVREKLIAAARDQALHVGYAGVTIRSVAKACDLGVGTVYNYFKSKEELIHMFMYEDWLKSVEVIQACSEQTDSPEELLRCIYRELYRFMEEHQCLLTDKNAAKVFAQAYAEGHLYMRNQLAGFIKGVCDRKAKEPSEFLPYFLADSLLIWTASGKSFEEIYGVFKAHF